MLRLGGVERAGHAGLDVAEGAGPRAGVAHDHEGGVLLVPALADIRAARLLAHRDEAVLLDDVAGVGIAARVRRADADPVRLRRRQRVRPVHLFGVARAQRLGGNGIDEDDHGVRKVSAKLLANPSARSSQPGRLGTLADRLRISAASRLFLPDSRCLKCFQAPKRPHAAPALGKPLKRSFFARSVHEVAPDLIGATLLFNGVGGVIVEVEAYHHTDPAAHSYQRADAAQPGDVRPAGICLRLSLLRHPLVREFRLREGGLGQRRADPRAGADPWLAAMRRRRGIGRRARAVLGPGQTDARRSASPREQAACRSTRPPFALHARDRKGRRRRPASGSASPRRWICPGATG